MNRLSLAYSAVTTMLLVAITVAAASSIAQEIQSPRRSSEYILNGKRIRVDYGSPSARGREIMGKLVPYNKLWTTGANKATTITIEGNIIIGGTLIPKGTYTLLTIPSEGVWKLILNKRLGMWCHTPYNSDIEKDEIARIDMMKEALDTPVNTLRIYFNESDFGVVLKIEWEKTSAQVLLVEAVGK
jgi:hypothetical protein